MFLSPPNLADYVAFLYGSVEIPPKFLPTATGTATGGSSTTLIDTTQTWVPNQWAGYVLTDGGIQVPIISSTVNTLTFAPITQTVNAGDVYWITPWVIPTSLSIAVNTVNPYLTITGQMYQIAVYNLATDRLINYAPDVPNQTFFADKRCEFKLTQVSIGVVGGASDQGTSATIVNPEQLKMLTLADLQTLKTPWGRQYMGIAQSVGSLWAIS